MFDLAEIVRGASAMRATIERVKTRPQSVADSLTQWVVGAGGGVGVESPDRWLERVNAWERRALESAKKGDTPAFKKHLEYGKELKRDLDAWAGFVTEVNFDAFYREVIVKSATDTLDVTQKLVVAFIVAVLAGVFVVVVVRGSR